MGAKVAVITGAGRGIGRACAVRFSNEGWRLTLVSRTRSELEDTASLAGGDCELVVGDVRDDAVQRAAASQRAAALIYCAGIAPLLPVEQTTPDILREVLDTNLTAAYGFARALWPDMRAAGGGSMVFISSLASRDPFVGFSAYAAAKAGVEGMVRALDREGKPHAIRSFAVAPGAVETAMFRKLLSPEQFPTERALSPDAVAEVVWQCVSGALAYSGGETLYMSRT